MKLIHKILIAIAVIVAIAFFFRSKPGKQFYNAIKKELNTDYEKKQRELDSIQKLRELDKVSYEILISDRNLKIELLNSKLESANQKIKQNEKLLNDYRSGDFNERFRQFTKLITNTDTVPR